MRRSKLVRDANGWKTLSSERQFGNSHLEVVTEKVQTPSSPQARVWTTVRRKAAVVIAPVTKEGEILLIKEERIPIRAVIWSMPAGQIDSEVEPDEAAIETVALRELHEETGYDLAPGGELIPLGYFFTSPGLTDEHCYLFLARPVQLADLHNREEGEAILDCRAVTTDQLSRMIAQNEIRDSNTLAICARLAARGFISLAPR
ncbi:MAG TPA: NUDIX hydrolase [Chthoniobacterales bacterium]|nr:NUDIX hydrolase [Chthoniobacterales bacterium]